MMGPWWAHDGHPKQGVVFAKARQLMEVVTMDKVDYPAFSMHITAVH